MPDENSSALPNGFELTELNPDFLRDPHAVLDRLREAAPRHVHRHAHFPDAPSGLYLTRMQDVRAILAESSFQRDPRATPAGSLARAFAPASVMQDGPHGNLLYLDGTQHRRVRSVMARAFTPRAIMAKKHAIESLAAAMLAELARQPEVDFISAYAGPFPIFVIARMLGLPDADMAQFRTWSEDLISVFNPLRTPEEDSRQKAAFAGLDAYFAACIAARRRRPTGDLLCAIVNGAADDGQPLLDIEISTLLLLLLLAGNLTTADVMGNGLNTLLAAPDEWAGLCADPSLAGLAAEECLRHGPPVAIAARYVPEDRTILGCPLARGAAIVLSLIAANHDPEAFDAAHDFRLRRGRRDHVAFGGGAHACPGAPLARLELEVTLRLLASRYPRLRLTAPAVRDRPTLGFVGFRRLMVALA